MVCEWFGLKTTWTFSTGLASKHVVTFFIGLASKSVTTVFSSLTSKLVATISPSLASKPAASFLVEPQNQGRRFVSDLASKPLGRFSPVGLKTGGDGFLVESQNQGGGGFPSWGLKTGSSGLVIWDSKSPRRFLDLGLKIKQASVCRLRHKTDGGRSTWDTCRDLAACLAWKQLWLGFPSLA
jgi:hypothetical protein